MVGGALLAGLVITRDRDPAPVEFSLPDSANVPVEVPEALQDANAANSSYAVGTRVRISIHLVRSLVGAGVGAMIATLMILLRPPVGGDRHPVRPRSEVLSSRNLSCMFCSAALFVAVWFGCIDLILRNAEPLTDVQCNLILRYTAALAIGVSWLVIGRKVRLGPTVGRAVNWLLLGPFNYRRLKRLDERQHKILWVGFALILFELLFPPWVAHHSTLGGKGLGAPDFVGFHLVGSDHYSVVRDSPYVLVEISHTGQLCLLLGTAVCTLLGICSLRRGTESEKQPGSGEEN
jgi:hypothetical protein